MKLIRLFLYTFLLTFASGLFAVLDSSGASAMEAQMAECEAKGIYVPRKEKILCANEIPTFSWICKNGVWEKSPIRDPQSESKCSNPSHINAGTQGCFAGGFDIFTSPVNQSFCVALCRRNSTDQNAITEAAMICHNPEGGGTCFFNTVGKVNLKTLSPVGQSCSWGYVGPNTCMKCHDNDPLIYTPFANPIFDALKAKGISVTNGKYFGVKAGSPPRTAYALDEAISCTECHRMGGPYTCGALADFARGQKAHGSLATTPDHCGDSGNPNRWMPPSKKILSAAEEATVQKDFARLKECCEDIGPYSYLPKSTTKCKWKEIPYDSSDRPIGHK